MYQVYFVLFLVCNWFKFPKDIAESPLIPGQLDLPQNAALWLKYFSTLNQLTLSKFDVSNIYK